MTNESIFRQRLISTQSGLFLLIAVHAALLAWAAVADSPTIDEPFHLAGGIRRLQNGAFDVDRGSPPLAGTVAAVPVVLMEPQTDWRNVPHAFAVGRDFVRSNGRRSFWYFTVGRWACIPFSILGGVICFLWARDLYGELAGLLAATLWCFSPNIIAHGHLITADMAATAFGAAAVYTFWKWLREPSLTRAVIAGFVLGAAELTKFVLVILYPLYLVLWVLWRVTKDGESTKKSVIHQFGHLAIITILSVDLINMAYLGRGTFEPLGRYKVGGKLLHLDLPGANAVSAGTSSPSSWLASLPVPLPADYILGIEEIDDWYTHTVKQSYLRGEWKQGGWWYYYLYGLLVKTPLGTLALIGFACMLSLGGNPYRAAWRDELVVLLPVAAILLFVTSYTSVNAHLRYVLPILPFVFVWTAKVAIAGLPKRTPVAAAVFVSLIAAVIGSLAVYPHSLSYFNVLAGGPKHGHEHLLDSNIDWGQDLFHLKKWLDAHPEARPLHLAYESLVDPKFAEIEHAPVPQLRLRGNDTARTEEYGPQPGWHAIRVHQMRQPEYAYFLRFRPIAMAGYSIYIFHISCEEANEIRRKLGLPILVCSIP